MEIGTDTTARIAADILIAALEARRSPRGEWAPRCGVTSDLYQRGINSVQRVR
jgi:hypothetical protein